MAEIAMKIKLIAPLTLLETLEVNVLACQPMSPQSCASEV